MNNRILTFYNSSKYFLIEYKKFDTDFKEFSKFVLDLDRRLSTLIISAFDDCNNLESVFKVNIIDFSQEKNCKVTLLGILNLVKFFYQTIKPL